MNPPASLRRSNLQDLVICLRSECFIFTSVEISFKIPISFIDLRSGCGESISHYLIAMAFLV